MTPAFVAGLLVALIHAPLGLEVLARGIVFIDLAIAQLATVVPWLLSTRLIGYARETPVRRLWQGA